jgi:hypothetical protein
VGVTRDRLPINCTRARVKLQINRISALPVWWCAFMYGTAEDFAMSLVSVGTPESYIEPKQHTCVKCGVGVASSIGAQATIPQADAKIN